MPKQRISNLFFINDLKIQDFPFSPKKWIDSNKLNFRGCSLYFRHFWMRDSISLRSWGDSEPSRSRK